MKRGVGIALLVVISLLGVGILSMGDVHRRGGQAQAMPVPEGKLIFVDDDFTDDPSNHKWDTITEALNDADDGDVIFVFNGRYEENIFVGHSVHLLGESQANVVIDGGSALYGVNLLADGIVFENMTVTNGLTGVYAANGYSDILISHCTITGSLNGVHISADGITVANCTLRDVHTAIQWEGSQNVIANTTISNADWGVMAYNSDNGTVQDVEAYDMENKTLVLENSENMTVRNSLIHDSFTGIWLTNAHYNTIDTCHLTGNKIGIRLDDATHNQITSCALIDNMGCGVYAEDSYFNIIHHNNFLGNGIHAYDTGLNYWNTSIGNYWDDYTGSDADGNGIGDSPYLLGGSNADHRPLTHIVSDTPSHVWVDDDFNASSPGWQTDHFARIQAGIAAAAPGGTVYVYNGTYSEGLSITTSLMVRAEPGATLAADHDGVFITASDVVLTGLSITAEQNGIKVQQAHNVSIQDCHVSQAIFGLYLVHTADCSVTTSSFFNNTKGIYLFNASSTLISDTHIHNNSCFGVELGHGSSGNVLSDCHLADNANYGLYATHDTADNAIRHNNFIHNGAYDAGANAWGGLRREVLGNYWSQYDGPDADHDGMIDQPYAIPGGSAVDPHPLKYKITNPPGFVWVNGGFNDSSPGGGLDHFSLISPALTQVEEEGGCYVFSGVYHEQVTLDKPVWVTGENPVNTTISGGGEGGVVISGDQVTVEHLGVSDCWNSHGVYVTGDDVLLLDCMMYDNYNGLYVTGDRVAVEHCVVRDSSYTGLLARYATYLTVSNCSFFSNNNGMVLAQVTNSTLTHNIFHNNSIVNLKIQEFSRYNLFHHNTFADSIYGVRIAFSTHNWFYLNNFLHHEVQAEDSATNHWDNGSVGNYWSDYDGEDNDYDGIGDTSYALSGGSNTDRYPLIREAGLPVAYFAYTPSANLNTQKTITFIDRSVDVDGYLVNWTWDFGDGNRSYLQSPQHRYADDGTYQVTLIITDDHGYTDVATHTLQVANVPPIVNFTWIPVFPTDLDTIQFTDHSVDPDGYLVNWTWDFGDGNVSYGPHVTHPYTAAGNYTVKLTVTDDDGDSSSRQVVLAVANAPPMAGFSFLPATPSTADSIAFTDGSVDMDGDLVNWTWDFGDGTVSYEQNPQHSYADDGTYQVTLTVTDDTNNTASMTMNITVLNDPPRAHFTYSPVNPVTVNEVEFTDQSVDHDGSIVSWLWEFGDGKTSSKRHPTHTYAVKGTYQVNLTVTDDDGDIATTSISLTVRNTPPTADFYFLPAEPTDLEEVRFYDQSMDPDGSIASYAWTFGDGNTSTSRNPSHRYEFNGVYSVSLTVTDNDGGTATATRSITVRNVPPEVNFSSTPAAPTDLDVVRFTANATDKDGTIANYSWTLGDGNRSYGARANHTYADDGVYTVTLTVTDDDGDATSHSAEITIANVKPTASFQYQPDDPTEDEYVTFTDLSKDPDGTVVNTTWDFGDGTIEEDGTILNHKYDDPGTYVVTLTVSDNDGATATTSQTVEVESSDGAAGFDFVLLVAALGVLLVMWRSRRGLWRRRHR